MTVCLAHLMSQTVEFRAELLECLLAIKIDIETCEQCGGTVKVINCIEDPYMALYGRLRFGKGYMGETQRGFGCTHIFCLELQTERLRALMEYARPGR